MTPRAEVVLAVGRYLKEKFAARLVIADSGGIGAHSRTERAFRNMGLVEAAAALGAELVNLETHGLMEVESHRGVVLRRFQATRLLAEVDAVVNLPKLKTHMLTRITGAVKNCLGLLPGALKRDVHVIAPTGELLAQAMVDICAAVRPALHVMDAVVGMEGAGPSRGRPRQVGWLLASTDPVALDAAAARIMGLAPPAVPIIALAARAGLGEADPSRIELTGAAWSQLPAPGYKPAFNRLMAALVAITPRGPAGRALKLLADSKPILVPKGCRACGLCVEGCPAGALVLEEGRLSLARDRCIECYCCLEHCPAEGLRAPRGLLDRLRRR